MSYSPIQSDKTFRLAPVKFDSLATIKADSLQGELAYDSTNKDLYLVLTDTDGATDATLLQVGGFRPIYEKETITTTSTIDDSYLHVCDSASAITVTIPDGSNNGEAIKLVNRGSGTVTLSGNISTVTATTQLLQGESVELIWDSTDSEWQ